MKIRKIYFKDVGPLNNELSPICFYDKWDDETKYSVLLSGPNGSGKSFLMNSIAYLWEALGYWLYDNRGIPYYSVIQDWFATKCRNIAVIIDEIPDFAFNGSESCSICLFFCDENWIEEIRRNELNINYWMGETNELVLNLEENKEVRPVGNFFTFNKHIVIKNNFLSKWSEVYKKFILSENFNKTPNIIYLDAEERKWIKASTNVGKIKGEDFSKRWVFKYECSEDWNTQLESSLINLSVVNSEKYNKVIDELNSFLNKKKILKEIKEDMRIRVRIQDKVSNEHYLDDLSSGERQVLILVYNVIRWLDKGGIAIVDEVDLFLHASLIDSMVATLEKIVRDRNGQLIVSSHNKDLWERFGDRRIRIELGDIFR